MFHHIPGFVVEVLSLAILLPFAVAVEMLSPLEKHSLRSRLLGGFYIVALPAASALITIPLGALWAKLGVTQLFSLAGLPMAARFGISLLLFDLLRYWEHRFEHRFWWPVHAVHHSVTDLHAANAYAHPLQAIPNLLLVSIPFSLVGGSMPIALTMFVAMQNLIIHSPLRVHAGPLRWAYVDSRFHRLHHSIEEHHRDRNFALVFSFWDRLFGTAVDPKPNEWPTAGIPNMPPAHQPLSLLLYPIWMARRYVPGMLTGLGAAPSP